MLKKLGDDKNNGRMPFTTINLFTNRPSTPTDSLSVVN